MVVANELGKTRSWVLDCMEVEDFTYQLAYLKVTEEKAEKLRKKQRNRPTRIRR